MSTFVGCQLAPIEANNDAGALVARESPRIDQLDAAGIPGGALTAEIPGQYRPSDQYLAGWTRDFFTVLAPPASTPGTPPPSARIRP